MISRARFVITSLIFMLVVVPAPPSDHVYGELFMVLTFDKLLASLNDCVKLLIADKTKLVVCNGSTPFGDCESLDEQGVIFQVKLADFKIFYSSKCLNTIKN